MKSLLLGCVFNFLLIFQLHANNLTLFECDFDKIEKELNSLSLIEDKIINQDNNYKLPAINKRFENTLYLNLQDPENSFEAGPFFLGCCLGVPGIAILYLTQGDNKNAMRSGVQGYLVGKVIITVLYIGYYVLILSQVPTTTF